MQEIIQEAPLLALRDSVVFPNIVASLFVSREKSLKALSSPVIIDGREYILLTTQKVPEIDDPKVSDLYKVGVLAKIIQYIKLPNNNTKLLVEATHKVSLENIYLKGGFFTAKYSIIHDGPIED